jgi:hypothetical protein
MWPSIATQFILLGLAQRGGGGGGHQPQKRGDNTITLLYVRAHIRTSSKRVKECQRFGCNDSEREARQTISVEARTAAIDDTIDRTEWH